MTRQDEHPPVQSRTGMGRRDFFRVTGAAATGFALVTQPVSAETITTPTGGLHTESLEIPRGGERIPAYLARPAGAGPFPAVLVIHEVFGLHEYIRDVARRLAHAGFLAVAPELFFREGGTQHLKTFEEVLAVVRSVPDRRMLDDLGAVLGHVRGLPACTGKVGVTGFCWGGGATWLLVADNPAVSAGVAWYGRLMNWGDNGTLHPNNPIDLAARMNAPVLGLYGGQDGGIPVSHVEEMGLELEDHGKVHAFQVYPEAKHAFHADYRANYHEAAARDGWQRCLAWFRKYLGN